MDDLIPTDDLPPIATAPQVAGVVQTTVDALAQDRYRRRGIPYVKIAGRVRYLRADVLKFLADNRIGGESDTGPPGATSFPVGGSTASRPAVVRRRGQPARTRPGGSDAA